MRFIILAVLLLGACGGGGSSSGTDTNTVNQALKRPLNTSCIAPTRPERRSAIKLTRAWPKLSFSRPVAMRQAPGDDSRWYVIEQGGTAFWFDATDEATALTTTYLDFSTIVADRGEGGLLDMVFHPDFANNRQVILSYTVEAPAGSTDNMVSHFSRMTEQTNGNALDVSSEQTVLTQNQFAGNHNGGHIDFGNDGFLYIGLGDGGGGGDPEENGQDTSTLLGSLLRLDIDASFPYTIPADNPFVGGGGRPEIYAWGLRNPWRWSFDRVTGDLWLGDVGQNTIEEINIIKKGGNYGWDCFEGNEVFETLACPASSELTAPVASYNHSEGISVTGGYVYRGNAIPGLQGVYLFSDFGTGTLWGLFPAGNGQYSRQVLLDSNLRVVSFAEANNGELFVLDFRGAIYRIEADVASGSVTSGGPAAKLSATGCVDAAMIPYGVNAPFWSDGAAKERFLALPEQTKISEITAADFELPIGAVTLKHFRLAGQLIETRLYVRHLDGHWGGYSYAWDAAGNDADLVAASGEDRLINGQVWRFPSRTECNACHTAAVGFTIGLEGLQLNGDFSYPLTGLTANQITAWELAGLLETPASNVMTAGFLLDPHDTTADTASRVRSYLHSNCANCHRPGGTTQSSMDLRFTTPFAQMNICDQSPEQGNLGIGQAKIVAPGEPEKSVLLERIRHNDQNRMPPIASNELDTAAIALLTGWIQALTDCQ
ncbi:MAG: PQQ-dependent sugar dehydrogenase [Gammaproteobacteria bacterium]